MKNFLVKNRYWLYFLYLPIYLAMFFLTEKYINGSSNYWVSYMPVDDIIPFVDWFVIFYYLWYPLLIIVAVALMIKDKPALDRYALMIIIGFTLSIAIFWIFPNGQNLRPSQFDRDNIFTKLIGLTYSTDTNTNVLPSIHVYASLVAMVAVIDSDKIKNLFFVVGVSVLAVLISASTVFIKQHSLLDVIGAVVMFVPIYFGVYFKRIFSKKTTIYTKTNKIAASEVDSDFVSEAVVSDVDTKEVENL